MLMCGYILCVLLYWWLVSVAKPVVTVDQTSYEVIEGSSVTLACRIISSSQTTSVTWQRNINGATLIIDTRSDRYSGGTIVSPSLVIKNTTLSDTGLYICSATNDAGVTSAPTIDLNVRGSKFKSKWIFFFEHEWDVTLQNLPYPHLMWCTVSPLIYWWNPKLLFLTVFTECFFFTLIYSKTRL